MNVQVLPLVFAQTHTYRQTSLTNRPTSIKGRFLSNAHDMMTLLQPETNFEIKLLSLPEFKQGMLWGEPRYGHPEGKVYLHVREVLDNIDLIEGISPTMRERLRIIALAHDTFKYCEEKTSPRDWNKHHGMLARKFMENWTEDQGLLDAIEMHDDAYYAWRISRGESGLEKTPDILKSLIARMGDDLQLYYLFFKCDTQTGDKTQASWKWFEKTVPNIKVTKIRE